MINRYIRKYTENVEEDNLKYFKTKQFDKIKKVDEDDFLSNLDYTLEPIEIAIRYYSDYRGWEYLKPNKLKTKVKNYGVKYKGEFYPLIRSKDKYFYIVVYTGWDD